MGRAAQSPRRIIPRPPVAGQWRLGEGRGEGAFPEGGSNGGGTASIGSGSGAGFRSPRPEGVGSDVRPGYSPTARRVARPPSAGYLDPDAAARFPAQPAPAARLLFDLGGEDGRTP